MSKLYVMCGVPASGKSTFINMNIHPDTDMHVSRDACRFALVKPNEEYFSKEKEVFKLFIDSIDAGLKDGYNVYADATHLNITSRNKLLNSIAEKPTSIEAIVFKVPLETCLKRNLNRKGTRGFVPEDTIKKMYHNFTIPTFNERFDKIHIIEER